MITLHYKLRRVNWYMELKDLIGESWFKILDKSEKECFINTITIVNEKRKTQDILPYEDKNSGVFYALKTTPFDKVKVLIIGQDPYPNKEDDPKDVRGCSCRQPVLRCMSCHRLCQPHH